MGKYPLYTVIIPTKDRETYLYHTLRTCLEQSYPNYRIIVADDASTDNSVAIVNKLIEKDSRIMLISRKRRVGMRENFEDALRQVQSGYVIALGGDDGLLPNAIEGINNVIQKTQTKLLTWCPPVFEYPSTDNPIGQFSICHHTKDKIVKSKDFLARQTINYNYLDIECPMFYVKGVASIDLINRVKARSKDGYFYSCPTPDGYSGIVLAGEVDSYLFSGKPFSIYGVSPSSQGQVYKNNDNASKEQSQEFFDFASAMTMHSDLANQPYSPLLALMTVDYLLTARDLQGWPGSFPPIDYKTMMKKAVYELSSCGYGEDRLEREVKILYNIANKHNISDYLSTLLFKAKRHGRSKIKIGNAISFNMLYLNASEFDISNIFDAAYAAKYISKTISKLNIKDIIQILKSSIGILGIKGKVNGDLKKYCKQQ
jgi:glycosyltransferase involved in cell wall biosynthesis